jgi:hypothetical protein
VEVVVFGLVAVVFLAIAGYAAWNAPARRARRLLAATPVTPVGALRPGERARVSGRVVLREVIESPLSGERCAAFHLKIEAKQGKNSWRTVVEDEQGAPFTVEDPSGTCFVDPRGTRLHLTFDRTGSTGTFDDPSPAEAAVFERYGVSSTTLLGFNRVLRLSEAVLAEDEAVTLLGVVEVVEVDGAPALTLVPDPEHGLVVTDHHSVTG